MRGIGTTIAALLLVSGAAVAATPESGSVSKSAPKVQWEASTTGSYFVINPMNNAASDVPCEAPACDAFALTVADDAPELEIAVNAKSDADDTVAGVRTARPDGTVEYSRGPSSNKTAHKLKIKNAAKGEYEIGIIDNTAGMSHKATATAIFPAAATPEPEPGASPTPAPSPSPQPQPGGQPQPGAQPEGFTVGAKVGKVSARKAKKGKTVAVKATSSRAIERMTVTLKKGAKTVGSATMAPFSGTGTLKIKLKSALKKGTYTLVVVGADGPRSTSKNLKVKVAK